MIKQFPVPAWERGHLELRAEFFNALNHPQFGNPSTGFTRGKLRPDPVSSVNPRVIQFALN